MRKFNIIVVLLFIIIVLAFLLGFSVAKSKGDTNQNTNTININTDTDTKDKTKVDLNTASKEELMSIKGIGEKKADLIIKNRPYKSIWDLSNIDGISEDFVKNIREEVFVDAES